MRRLASFAHHPEAVGAEMVAAVEHGELELGRVAAAGQEQPGGDVRFGSRRHPAMMLFVRGDGEVERDADLGLSVAGSDQTWKSPFRVDTDWMGDISRADRGLMRFNSSTTRP
jgi:hypothetical protein